MILFVIPGDVNVVLREIGYISGLCNFIEDLYERVNESNNPKTIFNTYSYE